MKAKKGESPVLLLDDVMGELDLQRRADLVSYLDGVEQTLLTTTDLRMFTAEFTARSEVWNVESGTVVTRRN